MVPPWPCPIASTRSCSTATCIAKAWIDLACQRLELGDPDLDSVRDLPTVRDLWAWGNLLEQIQDRCWRFRTRQGEGVLLACEVQSREDYLIMMRLVAYASVTVVALDRAEHFSARQPPPVPCLLLLHTGTRAWAPLGLDVLTGGRSRFAVAVPVFSTWTSCTRTSGPGACRGNWH